MATIKADLTEQGIQSLIDYLEEYNNSLDEKCEKISTKLAEDGASACENAVKGSEYGNYISVSTKNDGGGEATITAKNTGMIHRVWDSGQAYVNPLLMSEFGSGQYAVSSDSLYGIPDIGGRGTFPGQKHADEPEWKWRVDDKLYQSSGERPLRPLHGASLAVILSSVKVASEVFKK